MIANMQSNRSAPIKPIPSRSKCAMIFGIIFITMIDMRWHNVDTIIRNLKKIAAIWQPIAKIKTKFLIKMMKRNDGRMYHHNLFGAILQSKQRNALSLANGISTDENILRFKSIQFKNLDICIRVNMAWIGECSLGNQYIRWNYFYSFTGPISLQFKIT